MYQQPSLKHRITVVLYPQLCGMFVFVCSRSILLILRNRKSARCGIVKGSVLPNLVYRLNNPN